MGTSQTDTTQLARTVLEYPAPDRERLRKIAKAQDRSVAALHRVIIRDYLAAHDDTGAPLRNFELRGGNGGPMT